MWAGDRHSSPFTWENGLHLNALSFLMVLSRRSLQRRPLLGSQASVC